MIIDLRETARSLPVPRGLVSPVSGLLYSSTVLAPHLLLCWPVSWCLLVFVVLWATFCALVRVLGIYTPWKLPAPVLISALLGRSGAVQVTRIPPSLSPLFLPPFLSWSHPRQSWWSAELERNSEYFCHGWGWSVSKTEGLVGLCCVLHSLILSFVWEDIYFSMVGLSTILLHLNFSLSCLSVPQCWDV